MTIREIRCHRLSAPLHSPFVTALRRTTVLETLVVEVVDDAGLVGFGEAPQVWRVTGESLAGSEACVMGPLRDVLVGAAVADRCELLERVRAAVVGNVGAKSAVDVALHDLAAREQGQSLAAFLGTSRRTVRTDLTLSAGTATTLVDAARRALVHGFDTLKVKVGTDADDVRRICAVRSAVGPDIGLRVDANQGWTTSQAIRVIRALEDAGADLELVEQPVAANDLAGLARVTQAVDTVVLADEAVFGLRDLSTLIERGAADAVNIKLAKCGGLGPAQAMLTLARAHGVAVLVGSMMEGPVGVGAAAALVAAHGSSYTSDLDAAWWLAASPVVGGPSYDGRTIRLPEVPGLGVEGLR